MLDRVAVHHNAYLARFGPPMLDSRTGGTDLDGEVSDSVSADESEQVSETDE